MRHDRDAIADVGRALRPVLDAAAATNLTPRQYRVLMAVIRFTAAYSKLSDEVSLSQLEDCTHLERRHLRRTLHELGALGLIDYEPGESPKGRRRKVSRVGLPRLGADTIPRLQGAEVVPLSDVDRGPTGTPTGGRPEPRPGAGSGAKQGAGSGPPSEELSEKVSEAHADGDAETLLERVMEHPRFRRHVDDSRAGGIDVMLDDGAWRTLDEAATELGIASTVAGDAA